jgi:hypothetical protein
VNSPQVVDALVDLAIKTVLACNSWGNQPEKDILGLELKNGYTKFKVKYQ